MEQLNSAANPACTDCSLYENCSTVCLSPELDDKAKILVIAENPAEMDDRDGTLMQSSRDALFWQVVEQVIEADPALFKPTYLVRCYAGGKTGEEEIEACKKYLEEEVRRMKPKVVLGLGGAVLTAITGHESINQKRGVIQEVKIGSEMVQFLPTFSPQYLKHAEAQLETFAKDIQRAYHIVEGISDKVEMTDYEVVTTLDRVKEVMSYCEKVGCAAYDFETSGLEWKDDDFYATVLSISIQHGYSYVIPIDHFDTPFTGKLRQQLFDILNSGFFGNRKIRKGGHNIKFDMHVGRKIGLWPIKGRIDDTMLMHHLLDETVKQGLKPLTGKYMPRKENYEDQVEKYGWTKSPLGVLASYAATDTDMTLRFMYEFENRLWQDERKYNVYRNLSMFALRALQDMEYRGMDIDRELLVQYIEEADQYIEIQEQRLREYREVKSFEKVTREKKVQEKIAEVTEKLERTGQRMSKETKTYKKYLERLQGLKNGEINPYKEINFGSPVQLKELFYGKDGFNFTPYVDWRGTVHRSTGKDLITQLNDKTGFVDDLLLLRSLEKITKTYLKGVHSRLDSNNRLHTSFLQHGTVSGRLSSRNPNFQNIPNASRVKNELAKKVTSFVKRVFIPPQGYSIMQFDYSQAELRLIAEFSEDSNMIEAYQNNIDLHALTASTVMGIDLEKYNALSDKVKKEKRFQAKAVNFGFIYGMAAQSFKDYAKNNYGVEFTLPEAETARNRFFEKYPKILEYHAIYKAKAKRFGHVRTMTGRTRSCLEINSSDKKKKGDAERESINSPIQGSAGEFTIFALALLRNRLDSRIEMVNTVHDSIILYVPNDLVDLAVKQVSQTMENLPIEKYFGRGLKHVGMKVDAELSEESWGSLQEI